MQQEACLALCKAALTYNPDMGIKFSTFAASVIRNHFYHIYRMENFSCRKADKDLVSLDAPISTHGVESDETFTLHDVVADTRQSTEDEAILETFLNDDILQMIAPFTMDMYHLGVRQVEYAELVGLTRQRIQQIVYRERQMALEYYRTGHVPWKWINSRRNTGRRKAA